MIGHSGPNYGSDDRDELAVDPLRRHLLPEDHPLAAPTSAHVLVCVGPRCAARRSVELFEHVWGQAEANRIAYYSAGGSVRLCETGCLGSCDLGPSVVVYSRDLADSALLRTTHLVGMTAAATYAVAERTHRLWTTCARPNASAGVRGPVSESQR